MKKLKKERKEGRNVKEWLDNTLSMEDAEATEREAGLLSVSQDCYRRVVLVLKI